MGSPPFHANKQFINCHLVHWRGEMVKSVVTWDVGFIDVTNCAFVDGDASGYNFNWTPHVINGCLFSNLNMAMEYYAGTMQTNSVFENSVVTNTRIGLVLVGALANHPSPGYSILSNTISAAGYDICLGPARNVTITGNTFMGGTAGVATDGSAYQGTDCNQNILVQNNQFINTYYAFMDGGAWQDLTMNMVWQNNTAVGCNTFATGYGWATNIVFAANTGQGGLDSSQLTGGQWFVDATNTLSPCIDYAYAVTNIVSYDRGTQHQLYIYNNQPVVFLLDTGCPECIPPGAELVLTNPGQYPAPVYPASTDGQGIPWVMPPGSSSTYLWSNSVWTPINSNLGGMPIYAN
jgi:hypothetical protein